MQKINRFTHILLVLLVVAVLLVSSLFGGGVSKVYAASSTELTFDNTDVMDDLETATVNGKKFNVYDYPYDSTQVVKHPEILTVVEYCYSIRPTQRENYGLYIYFYNPQALNISTASRANKITLGVKYSTDSEGNVKVDDYEKFDLQFCSKSEGDYRDLFYKFKVIDHKSTVDGLTVVQRVNSNARRYDISEVELLTYGDKNATAYTVGGSYIFKGYAQGYGADHNAASTLTCERKDLETVTLDLAGVSDGVDKRTYWRSNSSSVGAHHQNQINSVFFAIDTGVLEKYGYTLQKIKAEWWEYKTVPAIVIDKKDIYDRLNEYSGVKISEDYDSSRGITLYNSDFFFLNTDGYSTIQYQYSWNADITDTWTSSKGSDYVDTVLPLLFYTNGISVDEYTLTAEKLQAYCEGYNKSYEKGNLQFNEHSFSADLFSSVVDSGRTRGYNLREFDITNPDDLWQINSYDSTHNWFQKLWDYGFGSITTNDDYADILPIQMLEAEDFAVSNVADHLKINPDDVSRLRDYFNTSVADKNNDGKPDNAVFLFRYAQTDYWAEDLHVYDIVNSTSYPYNSIGVHNPNIGEVRQGTQFFDFDILTMTFNKEGELTTLGCVSSPVDHWTGYTPSIEPTSPDWWKWIGMILGIIVFIIIIVLILKFCPWLIYGLFKLICLPFKGIGLLIKRKRKNKKAECKPKAKQPEPPELKGNVKPEDVDAYLDSIDWDSIDWSKLDGKGD